MKLCYLQQHEWSRECHPEWSKSDKKREILYDIAYVQNQKKYIKMNLFTKPKETDLENELMVCQVGRMERKDS